VLHQVLVKLCVKKGTLKLCCFAGGAQHMHCTLDFTVNRVGFYLVIRYVVACVPTRPLRA
jgi:hypothetical protein